jgi:hypothetical protein
MMRMKGEDCGFDRKGLNFKTIYYFLLLFRHYSTSISVELYHTAFHNDFVFSKNFLQLREHRFYSFLRETLNDL